MCDGLVGWFGSIEADISRDPNEFRKKHGKQKILADATRNRHYMNTLLVMIGWFQVVAFCVELASAVEALSYRVH